MESASYIDWNNLDLTSPEKVHEFARAVEAGGQRAVARAIADHKAIGNPIYFRDPAKYELLVKEMPDGRRFHVEISESGTETVIRQLSVG
ncbi:MAG: hypothetical protein WD767_10435 [Alphaproteobacteria bacterium]